MAVHGLRAAGNRRFVDREGKRSYEAGENIAGIADGGAFERALRAHLFAATGRGSNQSFGPSPRVVVGVARLDLSLRRLHGRRAVLRIAIEQTKHFAASQDGNQTTHVSRNVINSLLARSRMRTKS